ncbi:Cytochrome c oxidase subunit 2 precursor [Shimia sp. SK013]|uniref:cytochrome c oxidase subunit II n=1 Tax=Shimia sp. SK013 TaxID=1389006 RepID=UPI0006B5FB05|nr:cytochrome c oxidase subunit II [Shimia sp. SK013]KPA22157.1 Cytochrome c oxidase subunit 2 precursor [Shimia sp. SK013]
MRILSTFLGLMAAVTAVPAIAQAAEHLGKPEPKGTGFQPAATELATQIHRLDWLILVIITLIVVFVTGLMIWVMIRYNRRTNPNPSKFTHHTTLEIAWTVLPILILLFIGANSLPVLFNQQEIPEGEVHIKVTGYQWYWGYEYTDHEFEFESFLLPKEDLAANGYNADEYLLATDTRVVVPVGKTIVMDVTGADVIHSWTIPSFGVKQDAVPGRIAQLWFKAEREGVYFGQCSELCGKDHAYMPITVEVVSEEKYNAWLKGAIEEYAGDMSTIPAVKVAAAD